MPKLSRPTEPFNGVAAGQTAVANLSIGLSYHQLALSYSGIASLAQLTNIRIKANGQTVQNYRSGTEIDKYNQYEGRAAASGILVIDFDRFNLRTRRQQELTKLGTGFRFNDTRPTAALPNPEYNPNPITSLTVEMDINALATSPLLSMMAIQTAASPTGVLKKVRQFQQIATGAGVVEKADFPKGDAINQVFFTTAEISSLTVERDLFQSFQRSATQNNLFQTAGVRTPQSGYYVYDPTEEGNGEEFLQTAGVQDLRFKSTYDDAETTPISVVYLGNLER